MKRYKIEYTWGAKEKVCKIHVLASCFSQAFAILRGVNPAALPIKCTRVGTQQMELQM